MKRCAPLSLAPSLPDSLSCSLSSYLSLPLLPPLLLFSFMSKSQVVLSDARAMRAVWKHWSTKVKTTSTTTCQGLDKTKTGGGKIKVSKLQKRPRIHCSYFVKSEFTTNVCWLCLMRVSHQSRQKVEVALQWCCKWLFAGRAAATIYCD